MTLLIGATVAGLVIFQRPILILLEAAHGLEEQQGFAIVPGLVILGVVLLVNEVTRRSDERVQAAVDRVTMEERE